MRVFFVTAQSLPFLSDTLTAAVCPRHLLTSENSSGIMLTLGLLSLSATAGRGVSEYRRSDRSDSYAPAAHHPVYRSAPPRWSVPATVPPRHQLRYRR